MSTHKPADPRAQAAAQAWLGQRVGSHRLLRLLGEGGMGLVFEGAHEGIAGRAAIKILRGDVASRPEVVARFFNGARIKNRRRKTPCATPWGTTAGCGFGLDHAPYAGAHKSSASTDTGCSHSFS